MAGVSLLSPKLEVDVIQRGRGPVRVSLSDERDDVGDPRVAEVSSVGEDTLLHEEGIETETFSR